MQNPDFVMCKRKIDVMQVHDKRKIPVHLYISESIKDTFQKNRSIGGERWYFAKIARNKSTATLLNAYAFINSERFWQHILVRLL